MKHEIVEEKGYKGYKYIIKYIYTESLPEELAKLYQIEVYPAWYCGYVVIPKDHILYGIKRFDDKRLMNLGVHGGITFSGILTTLNGENEFCIGFDCAHYNDSPLIQNQDYVREECKSLINQIIKKESLSENRRN